ncbi:hypothetical protein A8C56_01330 [Niabella ginsenosidivorans]|uniref:Peptidyl-prolyl cis-trans isomerase n=1 Tax=Niabella ginsenosidivorans TaxID=1176587 RepID=A0A1A9HX25_9BACT|nr:FKBP-type peptidyl-prolyl cis-trans isomerase [Niabella ginsenosidivorans]ANH79793.1 hypothetical protein A8C56_01330 [Niabella ginsenosidivorans]
MKKALIIIIIATTLLGCLKNDDTPPCTNGLSLQQDRQIIDSFLSASHQTTSFTFDDQAALYYDIEDPGTGTNRPTTDSLVSFHYTGKLLNGTIIDSATVQPPPTMPLRNFGNLVYVPYALAKLTKGGKIRLIIPSSSAFGCRQMTGVNIVPPNSQLFYEYELTDMTPSY